MKLKLIALIALLGLLAACAPAATPPSPTPTMAPAEATPSAVPPTPVSAPPTQAPPTEAVSPTPAGTPLPTPDMEKIVNPQPEDWKFGPEGAAVTFIEWSDFQCPYCSEVAPLLKKLASTYPKEVQIVYRHFPLPTHDKSLLTAEASEAAGAQGKFWELEALLFEKQAEWTGQSAEEMRVTLTQFAEQIKLDVKQFNADLDAGKYTPRVQAARDLAGQLGLPGTPFLLINQQPWPQDMSLVYSNLEGMVKFFVELPKKQFKQAPAMTIDKTKSYTATLKTDKGDIQIKLLADKAPVAVNNFVFLAKAGWYNNVPFHRVLEGFMAQAGDPSGLGFGGPGYTFDNEVTGLKFDKAGLVAMANAGADPNGKGTNGSQFFITLAPAAELDAADPVKEANYTIFGEVVGGMDVVKQITLRDPQQTPEVVPTLIKTVTIEEK